MSFNWLYGWWSFYVDSQFSVFIYATEPTRWVWCGDPVYLYTISHLHRTLYNTTSPGNTLDTYASPNLSEQRQACSKEWTVTVCLFSFFFPLIHETCSTWHEDLLSSHPLLGKTNQKRNKEAFSWQRLLDNTVQFVHLSYASNDTVDSMCYPLAVTSGTLGFHKDSIITHN